MNRYIKRLAFLQRFFIALYLFSGCGMQQADKQSFDVLNAYCNYPFIQSLLLGRVYTPIQDHLSIIDPFWSNLAYTHDDLRHKVIAVQLIDIKQRSALKCLYRYKMVVDTTCLFGIKINFSFRDKQQPYQGSALLYKLHFKQLKKPNIRLTTPKKKFIH